ncbi:MAG: deoxyribonuclease V, partial [Gemmatimonadota bacterium]
NLETAGARAVQERLRERVRLAPLALGRVSAVAGCDLAVSRRIGRVVAAAVVVSYPDLDVLETRVLDSPLTFPYIPGLLSFREIPGLVACLERVETPFDAMLCDAQGIAHPRRLGLASHLGLMLDLPTVGCAKSRLVGEHDEPGRERGAWKPLYDRGERIGSVLRTRDGVKPLYVSPGHRVDHPASRRITLACSTRYRLPEPTRLADIAAGIEKRRLEGRR